MRNALVLTIFGVLAVITGVLASPSPTEANFHIMRIHSIMGGAGDDDLIQFVELRQATFGQNVVGGHDICFYRSDGLAYARFRFNVSVSNPADQSSILVGTSEFDAAWPGTPDFVFGGAGGTMTAIQTSPAPDLLHPIRAGAGKISFGTETESNPALQCDNGFFAVDTVVYGSGYSEQTPIVGPSGIGNPEPSNLPTAGTQALRYQAGTTTFPGSDNAAEYAVDDVNDPNSRNPRNNAGTIGDVTPPPPPDDDGDGVLNGSDNCPNWPNPGQELPPWPVPVGDTDCDGYANTISYELLASESFIETDLTDPCADTDTFMDERGPAFSEPVSPWPPDLNDTGQVEFGDALAYLPVFNAQDGDANYRERFDLTGDGWDDFSDILTLAPFFNDYCAPWG